VQHNRLPRQYSSGSTRHVLRSELGSEVAVTILTAGFLESEMTKGKAIQKDGDVAIDLEARDASCNKLSYLYSVYLSYVK